MDEHEEGLATRHTGKYCRVVYDFFESAWYLRLEGRHPHLMRKFYWLLRLAQDARSAGRIVNSSGRPLDAEDIALAWDRRSGAEDVREWQAFLDDLTAVKDSPVAKDDDSGYRFVRPHDWYIPASRAEGRDHKSEWEGRKERRNAARRKSNDEAREGSDSPSDAGDCPETPGEAREGSHSLGDAREGSVTPGQARQRSVTKPEPDHDNKYPPRRSSHERQAGDGSEGRGGDGTGSGLEDECRKVLAGLNGRGLHPAEERELAAYLDGPGPRKLKLPALREVVEQVRGEIATGRSGIKFPVRVAIQRAAEAVAREPTSSPWDQVHPALLQPRRPDPTPEEANQELIRQRDAIRAQLEEPDLPPHARAPLTRAVEHLTRRIDAFEKGA